MRLGDRSLMKIRSVWGLGGLVVLAVAMGSVAAWGAVPAADDQAGTLRFFGAPEADLFTREIADSLQGELDRNFTRVASNGLPAGFVSVSLPGMGWAGSMWSRDAGTLLRELTMRGDFKDAALLANCLIELVEKNKDGFYSYPRFFRGGAKASGTEFDGTAAVVIGLELLWERLPAADPMRGRIEEFLFKADSPVNFFKFRLAAAPLVAGSGEFGCGLSIPGDCYNVVQNYLTVLALTAAAKMATESGKMDLATEYRGLADKVRGSMETYLIGPDGAWLWCVDVKTLMADPEILNKKTNLGFAGINGVAAMYSDVLGLEPLSSSWKGIKVNEVTLAKLYETPLRKQEFDKYGMWTQFDALADGLLTGPSYGQGYAVQTALLYDKTAMAEKALDYLASATYKPVYQVHRDSPYYFYERMYSPDAVGKTELAEGTGALNLVNVTEPLKVSRLLLGVDDSSLDVVRILPRIPKNWTGVEARNWPVRTRAGVVRADILFVQKGTGAEMTVKVAGGMQIDDLKVRMPSKNGYVWQEQKHVSGARFVTR